MSGLPFGLIAILAAVKQWGLPSAAQVAQAQQALATLSWPAFAQMLEQGLQRDGYAVQRVNSAGVDFKLKREGRSTLVSARRWKSARSGLDALRPLQAACDAGDSGETPEAIYISLAPLSDNAQPFAAEHGITVWRAAELARVLKGVPLGHVKGA
jgi:restriction system protein